MNEMVERVAVALHNAGLTRRDDGPFADQSGAYQGLCLILARAAIEAMREPSEAMLHACVPDDDYLRVAWRIMIDAALAEPTETREPATVPA